MEMGSGGKAFTKHKWLGATTQSEAKQVVVAKGKEKEAEERRVPKKRRTPSKTTLSKKPVEKKKEVRKGGVQSRLADELTDEEPEEEEVAPLSKARRVVRRKELEQVRRRIVKETEEEEEESDEEGKEEERRRSRSVEEQAEDIDPATVRDNVLLDIEFQKLVSHFNNWRRMRLQLQPALSAWKDWEAEEQWVVEWIGSQDIHALTRLWYIEANWNRLRRESAARLTARNKGKAAADSGVHSEAIPTAGVPTQAEEEKGMKYAAHIAAHQDLTAHITDPTLIEGTFIQGAVDESLKTLAAEKRRREESEDEGDDEPLSKRFKLGESSGAGGSTIVLAEGEAQTSSPTPKDAEVAGETAVEGENQPSSIPTAPKNTDTLTAASEGEAEEEEALDYRDSPTHSEAARSKEAGVGEEASEDEADAAASNIATIIITDSEEEEAAADNDTTPVQPSTTLAVSILSKASVSTATAPTEPAQQAPHKPTLELLEEEETGNQE